MPVAQIPPGDSFASHERPLSNLQSTSISKIHTSSGVGGAVGTASSVHREWVGPFVGVEAGRRVLILLDVGLDLLDLDSLEALLVDLLGPDLDFEVAMLPLDDLDLDVGVVSLLDEVTSPGALVMDSLVSDLVFEVSMVGIDDFDLDVGVLLLLDLSLTEVASSGALLVDLLLREVDVDVFMVRIDAFDLDLDCVLLLDLDLEVTVVGLLVVHVGGSVPLGEALGARTLFFFDELLRSDSEFESLPDSLQETAENLDVVDDLLLLEPSSAQVGGKLG
jgi:hypothetical protein